MKRPRRTSRRGRFIGGGSNPHRVGAEERGQTVSSVPRKFRTRVSVDVHRRLNVAGPEQFHRHTGGCSLRGQQRGRPVTEILETPASLASPYPDCALADPKGSCALQVLRVRESFDELLAQDRVWALELL